MSAPPGPCYLFRTPEQRARLHSAGLAETVRVDPAAGVAMDLAAGCPIDSLTVAEDGALYWVDRRGQLGGIEGLEVGPAARLVAGGERLWLLSAPPGRLLQLDSATLQPLIDVAIDGLTDIAGDGRGGLYLLAGGRLRHLNDSGAEAASPPAPTEPASLIATAGGRLALLSQDGRRLAIRTPESAQALSIGLPDICATLSGGDDVFLLEAAAASGSAPRFLLVDSGGNLLVRGSWRDDRGPAVLALAGPDLVALFRNGGGGQELKRFPQLARIGGQRRMTPALETESPGGSWLRAEAVAALPEGATLALRWAATADESLRRAAEALLADESLPTSARLARLDALLSWSPVFTYVGARRDPADPGPVPAERFALPLDQAEGPILWVDVQLRSNAAAAAEPAMESLVIFHEAQSLMDDLPAIYSGDGDRDGTLRRLVGVLEATTQDIDRRIGRLAERLDPQRTDGRWLSDLAAMLGLPFHDALSPGMQRGLVLAAAPILAKRGTRDGLIAMLGALFPGRPVRVSDRTEQLIALALGGGRLPALLAGPSIRVPRLNARLVLARTALCRTDACADPPIAPSPQVLVTIPATPGERRRYGDAVAHMIEAMIPAGVRLRLSWTPWRGGGAGRLADDVLTMVDAPDALALGAGPALGRARTAGRRAARLDGSGAVPAAHRIL